MQRTRRETILAHSGPGPRYTSYPPATAFAEDFGIDALQSRLRAASHSAEPLALYLHIPFCVQRCGFCGCNVIATRRPEPAQDYLEALELEMALVAEQLGERRKVDRLHLGGGTPTYLATEGLLQLWEALSKHFEIDPAGELAIEIDPRVTTEGQLELLRSLGFSRLSLGVQDLDDVVQRKIGRIQPAELIRGQMERCRALGFRSINFDLLYGLPGQSRASVTRTMEQVISMRPDRLAVYGFAYMPQRFGHQRSIDPLDVPGLESRIDLQLLVSDALTAGGYRPVGFDHFALDEDELCTASAAGTLRRNFMGYTTWPPTDLIGLGVSAIGDVQGAFSQNAHKLGRYLESVHAGRLPVERGYRRNAEDEMRGEVIERLLCLMEADVDDVARRHGRSPSAFAPELEALRGLEAEGVVALQGSRVRISETGRFVARAVARVFDNHLQ